MHSHDHAAEARTRADFPTETEWAEWVRDYYRDIETYDWVDVADNLRGPEAIFHRNRRWTVRRLLAKFHAEASDARCRLRHRPEPGLAPVRERGAGYEPAQPDPGARAAAAARGGGRRHRGHAFRGRLVCDRGVHRGPGARPLPRDCAEGDPPGAEAWRPASWIRAVSFDDLEASASSPAPARATSRSTTSTGRRTCGPCSRAPG